MKFKVIIFLVFMISWFSAFAENSSAFVEEINEIISNAQIRRAQIIKEILKNRNGFTDYKKIAENKVKTQQEVVNNIKERHLKNYQKTIGTKSTYQAIVFVSFSMPDLSLKQIMQDAVRYKTPVVIRGLHHNSFKDTVEKIYSLIKEDNKGGILINPRWFKEYEITAVPAVIVSDGNNSDIVYGNIPLKRALSLIVEQGCHNIAKVAQDILQSGGI